jgi:hypothetical protein
MTNKEIQTLVKAAYVIVTPSGQTADNLNRLGEIFLHYFPSMTSVIVNEGEKMSMKQMVNNLEEFYSDKKKAIEIINQLIRSFSHPSSKSLGKEIIEILNTGYYDSYNMPELTGRIQNDEAIFESGEKTKVIVFEGIYRSKFIRIANVIIENAEANNDLDISNGMRTLLDSFLNLGLLPSANNLEQTLYLLILKYGNPSDLSFAEQIMAGNFTKATQF